MTNVMLLRRLRLSVRTHTQHPRSRNDKKLFQLIIWQTSFDAVRFFFVSFSCWLRCDGSHDDPFIPTSAKKSSKKRRKTKIKKDQTKHSSSVMHFRINFRSFHVHRRRRFGHHSSFGCCFHLHVVALMIIIHPQFRLINLEYVHRPNTSQHRWLLLYMVCSLSLELPMDDVVDDEALGQLGRNYTIWCTICFDWVAPPNYQQISLCFLSNSFTISSIRGGIKSTNQMVSWTKWNADSNWLTRLRVAALFISFEEKKRKNFFFCFGKIQIDMIHSI